MTNKKNGFWTFLFSLIPGAGEMYMGFFKQGISLMGLCVLLTAVVSFLGIDVLILFLPLIWFYSFFHVHHLRSLPPEEFHAIEDKFLFCGKYDWDLGEMTANRRKIIAILLVVVGVILLWNAAMSGIRWMLPDFMNELIWRLESLIPRVVIAILILYAGIRMLKGKKEDVYEAEEEMDDRQGGE